MNLPFGTRPLEVTKIITCSTLRVDKEIKHKERIWWTDSIPHVVLLMKAIRIWALPKIFSDLRVSFGTGAATNTGDVLFCEQVL